eukprot:Phypoly_transcript_00220.p1 GENE.Phypoly_transcript_00220~~Phypoly_transcript_00220.p1  ORF type:complete len:1904 (+),score=301.75 Phypoly_transcript_00220:90-5801(+)
MAQINLAFRSQLLYSPYNDILHFLATYAKQTGAPKKCTITYTWPITQEEQGMHERVMCLESDLKSVGVHASLDLTRGTPATYFETEILEWLRASDTVLLLGSPSYKKRAADPTTLTHKESQVLTQKYQANHNSVIPLLMAGSFMNAFPPGYTGTMGASLCTPEEYYQNFPEIAATLLQIRNRREVENKLKKYRSDTEIILQQANTLPEPQKAALLAQGELHNKSWAARLLVQKAKFSYDQLRVLDGRILESEHEIDAYCERITKPWLDCKPPEDITEGATVSLEERLCAFIQSEVEKVLLLQAPTGAHKTQSIQFMGAKVWQELNWVPVVIDLKKLEQVDEHCVANVLKSHNLDDVAISHAQATRRFLLWIEGFDTCGFQINLYVRNRLKDWRGKAVFTCRNSYIQNSAQGPFYFMPTDIHQRAHPQGLRIISYITAETAPAFTAEVAVDPTVEAHQSLLNEVAIRKPSRARELWKKAKAEIFLQLHRKAFISRYSNEQRAQLRKGFVILQQDIVRPLFHTFLARLAQLHEEMNGTPKKAFISYAWPTSKADCAALQARLLSLVQDMALAGIEVLLDILCLSVGVDINEFMQTGVETSDSIFWIGTPRLVQRIAFNPDGTPANPATIEFCHIKEKVTKVPGNALRPLLFLGASADKAFPPFPSAPPHVDFRTEKDYFKIVPQLAASVLGVDQHPEYRKLFSDFCTQMRALEATFTAESIWKRLETAEHELKREAERMNDRLNQLLNKIPDTLLEQLEGIKDAQLKAFHSQVPLIQSNILAKSTIVTQSLDLYIPLKGGMKPDTPPQNYFDVAIRVEDFLAQEYADNRVMLIQGGAGAGKTLFGRYLERRLWQSLQTTHFIPVFISLPRASDPYSNLVEHALNDLGFTDFSTESILSEKFVFILDGLDELPIDKMPSDGVLVSNGILNFTHSKTILTSRNHHIVALEARFGTTIHQHLTQQQATVEDVFMMPFDNSQINRYLSEYCRSPDAEWNDWTTFRDHIDTIPGLSALAQNPFMLRLLTTSLPRLLLSCIAKIESVDVYRVFVELWFEREMWKELTQHSGIPPEENRVARYRSLSHRVSHLMFKTGATTLHVSQLPLQPADLALLPGLPLHQQDGEVSFIHKSVQEFFVACAWVKSLTSPKPNLAAALFGARLASMDAGLLRFIALMCDHAQHCGPLVDLVLASRTARPKPDNTMQDDMPLEESELRELESSEPTPAELETRSIAAANAITVLNSTRFSFSGMDLSGINIPGAILDNAMLHKTNLAGANLTDASVKEVCMDGADITGSTLSRVFFGRQADIILPDPCCGVAAGRGGFVVVTKNGSILDHESSLERKRLSSVKTLCCTVSDDVLYIGTSLGVIRGLDADNEPIINPIKCSTAVLCVAEYEGTIISGGADGTVGMWDSSTGRIVRQLRGHTKEVLCIAVQYPVIVSGSADGTICVWDLATGRQPVPPLAEHSGAVRCLAFCEGRLVSGGADATLRVWDATTFTRTGDPLLGHADSVTSLAVFEEKVISGSADATIRIWDILAGKQVGDLLMIYSPVVSLAVWDGKVLVGCNNNRVQVHNISSNPRLQLDEPLPGFSDRVNCVCLVDGKIAISGADSTIQIVDAVTQRQVAELRGHKRTVRCIVPFGKNIVSLGGEQIILWDLTTGNPEIQIPSGNVDLLVELNNKLITSGREGLFVVDIKTAGKRELVRGHILAFAADPETNIVSFNLRGHLTLVEAETGNQLFTVRIESGMKCVASTKGQLIVAPALSPAIEVWSLVTGKCTGILQGHTKIVNKLVAYEGKAASSDGHAVCVWDVAKCECLCAVTLVETVTALALSNEWLVIASEGALKQRMVQWWKIDEEAKEAYLVGVSPGRWPLSMRDCKAITVQGLSEEHQSLLEQLGANLSIEVHN